VADLDERFQLMPAASRAVGGPAAGASCAGVGAASIPASSAIGRAANQRVERSMVDSFARDGTMSFVWSRKIQT